ncbi:MAG TPA: DUF2695 domain-containing protein, partial [Propionibacteriaceae bacterium]|nr:DUF2695 domain-containing protein [Propionibacteriaceae bacterium]
MTAEFELAPVLHIERELRHLSVELTQPKPRECLHCYVYGMLEFGCTGLRWATRYRDLKAPRATALGERLMSKGAGCDCEIFINGWSLRRTYQVWDPETEEYDYPKSCPPANAFEPVPSSLVVSGLSAATGSGIRSSGRALADTLTDQDP